MLELPEVEVLRKDLEKEAVTKRIKDVSVKNASIVRGFHRTRPDFQKALEGRRVEGVRRRGTVLFLDLDGDVTWVIAMGETSSLHRETMNAEAGADTDVVVSFTTGGAIHISDVQKGDSCRTGVVQTSAAIELSGVSTEALDPYEDSITWIDFGERLRVSAAPLKTFLMDDSELLGIGTVYSDEVLFEAGLAHDRMSQTLTTQEVRRLYRALQEVLQSAVKQRGTSIDEVAGDDAFDEEGEPAGHLRVYGREGLPCLRCRRTVVKTKLKGKKDAFTYHCERCQM